MLASLAQFSAGYAQDRWAAWQRLLRSPGLGLLLAGLLLQTSLLSNPLLAQNLLSNSTFEESIEPWEELNGRWSVIEEGNRRFVTITAAWCYNLGCETGLISECLALPEDHGLRLELWAKGTDPTSGEAPGGTDLWVFHYDDDSCVGESLEIRREIHSPNSTTTWEFYQDEYLPPVGARSARVMFSYKGFLAADGQFDDVRLLVVPDPSAIPAAGPMGGFLLALLLGLFGVRSMERNGRNAKGGRGR